MLFGQQKIAGDFYFFCKHKLQIDIIKLGTNAKWDNDYWTVWIVFCN